MSACKASILLRKTARAVVRRARRTLFAPRFRSRSIVAPAHKPATIFSDQSPRDEHERLREVRVRPEGNGATKKPQHSLRLFLVHQIEPSLKDCNKKRAAISCNAYFGAPSVGALRIQSCGLNLATSPRETNTSACAKCESVPEGMVRQKSRNIRCGFSWCTIGDSNPGPTD